MRNYHANRDDAFPNNPEFGSKVVRITVCKSCPQQTAIDFTQHLRYAGLSYDFVDKTQQKRKTPYPTPKLLLLRLQLQTRYAVSKA